LHHRIVTVECKKQGTTNCDCALQNEMELEQITGVQQPLYHRYSTDENEDDDGDDDDGEAAGEEFKTGAFDFGAEMITEAIQGMDINMMYLGSDNSNEDVLKGDDPGKK
jgi:hypothetical protein